MKTSDILEEQQHPSDKVRTNRTTLIFSLVALLQFIALMIWTIFKWHRYAYTYDFAIYYQAAYLISHGHMDPFSTILGFPFIQNDFEVIMWPIGWLLAIVRTPFLLPFLQDLSLSATTLITLLWVRDIVRASSRVTLVEQYVLQAVACILIIATPWAYWAASFDFHIEPVILPFVVLAGWSFWKNRRPMGYLWTAIFLTGGNVAATYVFGLGIMEVVRGRKHFRNGILLFVISGCALIAIEKLVPGGIRGGNIASYYGYLAGSSAKHLTIINIGLGMLLHPQTALSVLWQHRLNIYGEISPAGLIGYFSPIGIGVAFVVLLTDNLISSPHNIHAGLMFGDPEYFQGLVAVPFIVIGTIFVVNYLRKYFRHRWILAWYGILVTIIANTVVWAFVYIPRIPHQLVNINKPAAQVLSSVYHETTASQQVVSTLAFVGRFAGRQSVSTFMNDGPSVSITNHRVLFVVSPYQGIEAASVDVELARIWNIANLPGISLLKQGGGIWAFNWKSPKVSASLNLNKPPKLFPAWALRHPAGQPVLSGPVSQWHISSSGKTGYLVDGFYKRLSPGAYKAVVNLSTTTPVTVEVWNATGSYLLRRDTLPPTNGQKETLTIPFISRRIFPHENFFHGYGLWQVLPPPPQRKNELELRIWSSGNQLTNIYGVNFASRR